jgi:hypothetical protein
LAAYVAVQRHRGVQPWFEFQGESYRYFAHHYNTTWKNERSVEVPIARRFLESTAGPGAEIGNVLSHYGAISHTVVDKYERSDMVLNVDVVDYHPSEPLNYIVAISTLEHVGWDETPRDREKAVLALRHLRSLLTQDGRLLVTIPVGHNLALDEYIFSELSSPLRCGFLHRTSIRDRFTECERSMAEHSAVRPGGCHVLWVAEFGWSSGE